MLFQLRKARNVTHRNTAQDDSTSLWHFAGPEVTLQGKIMDLKSPYWSSTAMFED